jgi:hypothetical protein
VSAGVVRVEVLVDIEDELALATSRVGNAEEGRTGLSGEGRRRGERAAWDEDELRCSAGSTDGVDSYKIISSRRFPTSLSKLTYQPGRMTPRE